MFEITTPQSTHRLRNHHLLHDGQGHLIHIYDLERTMIFDVPEMFRSTVDLTAVSPEMFAWMKEKDLTTTNPFVSWSDSARTELPVLTDLSMDMSGACNLGCVYCFENEIDSRIGRMNVSTALSTLDFFFKQNKNAKKTKYEHTIT